MAVFPTHCHRSEGICIGGTVKLGTAGTAPEGRSPLRASGAPGRDTAGAVGSTDGGGKCTASSMVETLLFGTTTTPPSRG